MLLMWKDVKIGKYYSGLGFVQLVDNLTDYIPANILFIKRLFATDIVLQWLEFRFPPAQREASRQMCTALNIPYHDAVKFLELTRGCIYNDHLWIQLKSTDKYKDFHIRPLD